MNTDENIIDIHKEIQNNLLKMLPEKFKKICLFASVNESNDEIKKGEMFFYYFPAGILKKNPINVYEIPGMFNIDEEQYAKLESNLYESIKKLQNDYKSKDGKNWTNLTITIMDTKYIVEFNYDDLSKSEFDGFARHIIWRYKYLELPIESFNKDERMILKSYFNSQEFDNAINYIYQENIYEKPKITITSYSNDNYAKEGEVKKKEQEQDQETQKNVKNQLLNF